MIDLRIEKQGGGHREFMENNYCDYISTCLHNRFLCTSKENANKY